MKNLLLFSILLLAVTSPTIAAWFQIQAKDFPRVEMMANKQIVLYRPLNQADITLTSFYPTGNQGEAGLVGQFLFTPPTGVESQFLSILLSALATKGTIFVEGHLPTGSDQITSTRIQIQ
jgi:hypothetical protein